MGQKIQEKEIVKQKFIAAVHSYFASLQTHNSSLSNRRIVHGVQHLALPLGELAAKPTERALSAPTGAPLPWGEAREALLSVRQIPVCRTTDREQLVNQPIPFCYFDGRFPKEHKPTQ